MKIEQLIREHLIKLSEQKESPNYMFFSNLEQMIRQCNMLLEMDQEKIDSILLNGHDWAADHVTVAKENMDQVFDFIMNEMKGAGDQDQSQETEFNESVEEIDESKNCPTDPAKWAASKAAAKRKFDVYPSAYANGWAAKNYKAKGGGWKKCK
jgi:hypothetical protein